MSAHALLTLALFAGAAIAAGGTIRLAVGPNIARIGAALAGRGAGV